MERLPELRDLLHDHLGPRGLLHDLLPGVEQRRPDRDLVGLADHLGLHPHHRLLHGRARLGLPDRRRHLLVVVAARQPDVGLVHRLVQPARADRDPRLGRLLLRAVPGHRARPLRRQRPGAELRRQPPWAEGDVRAVRADPRAARLHQHPRQPPRRRVQRHLRVVAPRRRRGDHRDPHLRPRQPRELQLGLHRPHQQLGLQPGHVLVVRAAAGLPADAVHDHRLRRLGPHLGGDPRLRERRAEGRVALGVLVRGDRLHRAAGDHVRGRRSGRGHRGRRAAPRPSSWPR